jgi:hypothetical protein
MRLPKTSPFCPILGQNGSDFDEKGLFLAQSSQIRIIRFGRQNMAGCTPTKCRMVDWPCVASVPHKIAWRAVSFPLRQMLKNRPMYLGENLKFSLFFTQNWPILGPNCPFLAPFVEIALGPFCRFRAPIGPFPSLLERP